MTEVAWQPEEAFARQLDEADPLRRYRDEFLIPCRADGQPQIYFCGHSLGLQPRRARAFVEQELDDWARLGVEAHFHGQSPWYSYHELFRETGARLVGAKPGEVVFMNSLTVNLHLMMITFYRPWRGRSLIVIDEPAFPSDMYAVKSQIRHHGLDPAETLVSVRPRPGENGVREEDLEALLDQRGNEVALVLWNGVNFLTGQRFDIARITAAAHKHGTVAGFDLAHSAGNVLLELNDAQVDFAVWCSYKYLNSGPGAVAGCFVHERHGRAIDLPRLAGWWGNDPATRFQMQLQPEFVPHIGAEGWQVSNPPILAMAPLRASLGLFDEAGMVALRAKSVWLTSYLLYLLERIPAQPFEILTPLKASQRGSQISIMINQDARAVLVALDAAGVVSDFRQPNVIRVAPVPLYNTYHEVWRFADILGRVFSATGRG
jgi:kynureninase